MNFILFISSSPQTRPNSASAYRFASTVIERGFMLSQVFFFNDGIFNGIASLEHNPEEPNLVAAWQALASKQTTSLKLCSGACGRRGILSEQLADGFELGSLGQFITDCHTADRVVPFN